MTVNITDLSILTKTIEKHNLNFVLGSRTVANGNCFVDGLYQNISYLSGKNS